MGQMRKRYLRCNLDSFEVVAPHSLWVPKTLPLLPAVQGTCSRQADPLVALPSVCFSFSFFFFFRTRKIQYLQFLEFQAHLAYRMMTAMTTMTTITMTTMRPMVRKVISFFLR